jgi:hypothetical protein
MGGYMSGGFLSDDFCSVTTGGNRRVKGIVD